MSWFNAKSATAPKPTTSTKPARRPSHHVHPDAAMEQRIAEFLIGHGRLAARNGRPLMHFLGTCKHHDGSTDYSVRTRVRDGNGVEQRYDSHVRHLPTDHLKLVR